MSDQTPTPASESLGRFLRMEDLANLPERDGQPARRGELGVSRATIDRWHKDGDFPAKVQLSPGCVGWWERDIEAWKASRPRADAHR